MDGPASPEDVVERVLDELLTLEGEELDLQVAADNIVIALRAAGHLPPQD